MANAKKTNIIGGSRDDDEIRGGDGGDKILGHGGDDRLGGSAGGDRLFGSTGNDVLLGGTGNDWLKGDTGNDVLNGGAGSDRVDGGPGNDVAIYVLAENRRSEDDYDGGSGIDTLRLVFTGAEWARADVKADVARFIDFLANEINPSGQAKGHEFEFKAFDLEVTKFEKLEVVVDGRVIDPRGTVVDAVNDAITVGEDGSVSGNVLTNDIVPNLSQVELVTSTAHGALTFVADGSYTYVPGAYFNALAVGQTATESFVYRVTDASGSTDTATVTLSITGANDGPVARADNYAGAEDTVLTGNVLANDTDPDNDALTIVSPGIQYTAQGSVVIDASGAFQYTPLLNYSGSDSFSYTVSDGHGGISTASVAVTVRAVADTPLLTVPENNLGFERGLAGWETLGTVAAEQQHGGILPAEQGWLAWVDASGASDAAVERFTGIAPGALDAMAAGDATAGGAMRAPLIVTAGDTITFKYNFVAHDDPTYNDFAFVVSGDGHAVKLADVATVGSGNATGWHTYSFTAAATGSLELALGMMSVGDTQLNSHLLVDDIRVNGASPYVPATEGVPIPLDMSALLTDADGSETLVVDISSLPAGALLSSGTDLGGGHWALTGAQLAGLTLTTPQDFTGLFTVNAAARATEASNGDVAAVSKDFTIMVNPANHAPVAASDAAATNEDSTVLVNVLANDTDSNGDLLTIASLFGATSAQGATLSIVNGQVLYDPSTSAALQALDRGQSLTDTFSYMASDGRGGTATAQASVEVAGVHDGMQGVALDYAYLFPDGTSPIFETQVVPGAGIELDGLYGEYTPGRLDLTDDRIIVDFLSDGTATAADFNGFHLSDHAGALPAILDVTVAQNTIAGFTDARITHDANNVFVNLQGLQYDASSHLELQVVF